jgi:invasion protein IalB
MFSSLVANIALAIGLAGPFGQMPADIAGNITQKPVILAQSRSIGARTPPGVVPPQDGGVRVPSGEVPQLDGSKSTDAAQDEDVSGKTQQRAGTAGVGSAGSGPAPAVANRSPANAQYEDFGDWRVECYDPPILGVRCQIIQQVINRQARQPVFIVSMAYIPAQNGTEVEMAVPLGLRLADGVEIKIASYSLTFKVESCTNAGCKVDGSVPGDMIDAMKRGSRGAALLTVSDSEVFTIPFSLNGFTKAFDAMRKRNEAHAKILGGQ